MRLRSSFTLLPLAFALLAVTALSSQAAQAPPGAARVVVESAVGSEPTSEEIENALEKVKADPNFATERKVKTLH